MKLVSAEPATEGGKRGAAITVENPSAMYSYFSDAGIVLESGSWHKAYHCRRVEGRQSDTGSCCLARNAGSSFQRRSCGRGKISATLNYTPKTAK